MKNNSLDMDIVQYSDKIAELLKGKNISTVVEIFPQYTLVLSKLRLSGVNKYYGIEPEYPERTQQAINYYYSMGLNNLLAQVINQAPEEYLKKQKKIQSMVAFISFKLDEKLSDVGSLAKTLYNITPAECLNVHLGLKDDKPFIDAGFQKENSVYIKK